MESFRHDFEMHHNYVMFGIRKTRHECNASMAWWTYSSDDRSIWNRLQCCGNSITISASFHRHFWFCIFFPLCKLFMLIEYARQTDPAVKQSISTGGSECRRNSKRFQRLPVNQPVLRSSVCRISFFFMAHNSPVKYAMIRLRLECSVYMRSTEKTHRIFPRIQFDTAMTSKEPPMNYDYSDI